MKDGKDGGPRCYVALTLTLSRGAGEGIGVVGGGIASIRSVVTGSGRWCDRDVVSRVESLAGSGVFTLWGWVISC